MEHHKIRHLKKPVAHNTQIKKMIEDKHPIWVLFFWPFSYQNAIKSIGMTGSAEKGIMEKLLSSPMFKHKRHMLKTISWRVVASTTTFFLSLWVTQGIALSSLIMSYNMVTKNILYYLHEMMWSKLSWGMKGHRGSSKRHFAKAVSWRLLGSCMTCLITWLLTSNIHWGLSIASYEIALKIFLYHGHEMLWNKSSFGIQNHPPKASS